MSADRQQDLNTHFDEHGYDVPDSPEDTAAAAAELLNRAAQQVSRMEQADALSLAGVYLRRLGRLEVAAECLEVALRLFREEGRTKKALVASIRLGHVYQWQSKFADADRLFGEAIGACERDPELAGHLDFAYQHYGRSLLDQARYEEAEATFQKALQIRLSKGDEELIESTQGALALAQSRLGDETKQAEEQG
jgi:tetratricopeptide (TPR) repeat protein